MTFTISSPLFMSIFNLYNINGVVKRRKRRQVFDVYWKHWLKKNTKFKKMSTKKNLSLMAEEVFEKEMSNLELPTID